MAEREPLCTVARFLLQALVLFLIVGHACELPAYARVLHPHDVTEADHHSAQDSADQPEISCESVDATTTSDSVAVGARLAIGETLAVVRPITARVLSSFVKNAGSFLDGVAGLTQPYIKPGETGKYEWTLRQYGTLMFHSHHDEMTQMGMGLIGMFVVHPRNPSPDYRVDRDFSLMISEWSVKAGTARPNTLEMMDFNVLTLNGKVFPSTAPLVCKTGDRVRIRLGNLGAMDHHSMHIHGHQFRVTATDGDDIPLSAQWPETTVLVAVGQTRNIEFIADAPGDWAFHCHMTHHVMNQMGHEFPNMVGMNPAGLDQKIRPLLPAYMTHGHTGMDMGKMAEVMPYPPNTISMKGATGPFGDYISMGGLFTIVKVRDELKNYDEDPGWYQHPPGTVALKATDADLARDGINVDEPSTSGAERVPASPRNGGRRISPPLDTEDPHKRH